MSHLDDAGSVLEVGEGPHDVLTHGLHRLLPGGGEAADQLSDPSYTHTHRCWWSVVVGGWGGLRRAATVTRNRCTVSQEEVGGAMQPDRETQLKAWRPFVSEENGTQPCGETTQWKWSCGRCCCVLPPRGDTTFKVHRGADCYWSNHVLSQCSKPCEASSRPRSDCMCDITEETELSVKLISNQ